MAPLFTNRSTFTKANLIEVNRGTSSQGYRIALFACLGLLFFIAGLLIREYAICLFGIFFGILYPLVSIWAVRRSATIRYQQFQQLYHSELETVSSFYEDHFEVQNLQDGAVTRIDYPTIAKVHETRNLFFLMLSTRIGFMLEKARFEGTTAEEFGRFIRARAVGEGRIELGRKKQKAAFITATIFLVALVIGLGFGFFGEAIGNAIPRTFSNGDYSIRLTSAFDVHDDVWENSDVTVYSFCDSGTDFATAAAYLQDLNGTYDIHSVVTPASDTVAWTTYTDQYEGQEFFNFDYVIMSDGVFWYTEFYCLAKDADHYKPLFDKWANTIRIR